MTARHVPLAVDAQIRIPFGPMLIPLRTLCVLVGVSPIALVVLGIGAVPFTYRVGLALSTLLAGFGVATPEREGVWIVTWYLYRLGSRLAPNVVLDGKPASARVKTVAGAARIAGAHPSPLLRRLRRSSWADAVAVPSVASTEPGVMRLTPGGSRAVLMLEGPTSSLTSSRYELWCEHVVHWLLAVDCPSQVVAVLDHHDRPRAEAAFDQRVKRWPRTPLVDLERELSGSVAEHSVRFRHYVVLAPGMSGADGLPVARGVGGLARARAASDEDATRALQSAMRVAASMDLDVRIPDRDDLALLLRDTLLGTTSAAVSSDGTVQVGDEVEVPMTVVRLPSSVHPGILVDALLRVRLRGIVSLHILPVSPGVARRLLDRRASLHRFTAREGNDGVDNQVALAETAAVLAAIAQRELRPCRMALSVAVRAASRELVAATAERLEGLLSSRGVGVVRVTTPGFLGSLASSPGCMPLTRSLLLTSGDVVTCLLPALGTPFSDHRQPLVGTSLATNAPAYLSVWSRPNYNALVLGSSGAGKSVAAKTLLIRHVMEGASAVVIDPDSEYRRMMNAVGGEHFELGDDSLNVLAAGSETSADLAASTVLPVLSVMAGDEKGMVEGRPIRRLADEDQAWLHGETADFFRAWRGAHPVGEPLLRDLVAHLELKSLQQVLTSRAAERCRVVIARLRRFTQGHRAHVFDRPSTFAVGDRPIAIGLRAFALTYAADLTPALAVVLTAILADLGRRTRRAIVLVDEAHRVTSDPDAGAVLAQLVRQARKHGTGIWMCSQRVEDFIATDLGKTLAATSAIKLILGTEEAAASQVSQVFSLDDEERTAITPMKQGCGVLLSAGERAVIMVSPGPAIMALADTTPPPIATQASAAER